MSLHEAHHTVRHDGEHPARRGTNPHYAKVCRAPEGMLRIVQTDPRGGEMTVWKDVRGYAAVLAEFDRMMSDQILVMSVYDDHGEQVDIGQAEYGT